MKKILTLLLCLFMTLTCTNVIKADGTTVYVDPTGETEGAYERLDLAAAALPAEGGIIVIKRDADTSLSSSSATLTATGKITIVGESPSVRLTQKRALVVNCELEIDNLTLVNGAASGFDNILCQGNNVTFGNNLTTVPNGSRYINIYAGKTTGPLSGVTANINIHGGQWKNVYSGNNSKAFSGTVNFDFANTTIEAFALSGNAGASTATVNAVIHNATNISSIQKTINNGTYTGTSSVSLEGGTIGSITDVVPTIDLSNAGTLTLNSTSTVGNIIGGGNLNLGNGATLTSDDLSGTTNLSIASPVTDTTYLTINNTAATGSINYIPQGTETLNRTVGASAIEYTIGSAPAPIVVDTVYLDPAGTSAHTEHVYTTIEDAVAALPNEGGTIVVCSDAQIATASAHYYMDPKPIRITGENANVKLTQNRSWFMKDNLTIDNITWVNNSNSSYAFIYTQAHDLTVGENVTCVPNGSVYLCILAGSANIAGKADGNISNGNCTITVESGTFRRLFAGGLSRTYSGVVNFIVDGATIANNIYCTGSSSGGDTTGTVNVTVSSGSVADISRTSASGTLTGTANVLFESGTIGTVNNLTPDIDLSDGGTLNLNSSFTADSIIGGGKLNLSGSTALTTGSLTGSIDLEVSEPDDGFVYLTINDASTTGVVNYIAKSSETLNRVENVDNIQYVMENTIKTHIKVTYYNPDGASEVQPQIALWKGYSSDTDKVKILDYTSGLDGYKNYIEADLGPGLYYFIIYYNASNDYARKYIFITGEETSDLEYDFPFIPYTANHHEEPTISLTTDQVTHAFWNFDDITGIDPVNLATPSFTMDKYTRNIRYFMDNEDLCNFVDNMSSPYLHVYYPFALSPMGNKFPVLVFTKDNVDSNISLLDLAEEVRSQGNREILMINGGQHGNEPSGMEGALQFAYELTTEYGNDVLDHFGAVVVLPCVQLDNTQRFKREYDNGLNSNRDLMYLSRDGSQNIAYIYKTFMPTVFVSCHEDNENNTIDTTDNYSINDVHNLAYCSITTPNSPIIDTNGIVNGTFDVVNSDVAQMCHSLIDTANAQGFRATHYPTPSYAAVSERTYTLVRGSYAFLIEVQRIWSGKNNYDYSVKEMTVALRNLVAKVIDKDTNDAKTIAQKVYEAREAAKVTTFDENNYFILKMTANVKGSDPFVKAYANGTYENTTKTYKFYDTATAYRSLPLSYVIPADLTHIDDILHLLDMHGIAYTSIPSGTTRVLKEYSISDTSSNHGSPVVSLGENTEVTFENGAYEISLNTSDAYLIAYLFEPDAYNTSTFYYTSLYNMAYLDTTDHLYRYETDTIPTGDPSNVRFLVDGIQYELYEDVPYNHLIEKPSTDPSKEGYIFTGWYKDSGCTSEWVFTKDRVTENKTLYAGFEEGRIVSVQAGGYGTAHYAVESSSWADSTGGVVNGAESYVTTLGDYHNTSGAALSIYTDLSDVTALKIKVGNNPELTIPYTGTKITRYVTGSNTISTTGTPASDVVKIVLNASTSTLTSTRFYNIAENITFTYVHNTRNITYTDERQATSNYSYTTQIPGFLPAGASYDVPVSSLGYQDDSYNVNLHLLLDNTRVDGIRISTPNNIEVDVYKFTPSVIDTDLGKVTITPHIVDEFDLEYDIFFDKLDYNATVRPIYVPIDDQRATGTLEENGTFDFVITGKVEDTVDLNTSYVQVDNQSTILSEITENGVVTFKTPAKAPRQLADDISIRYYDQYDNPLTDETKFNVPYYINVLLAMPSTSDLAKAFYKSLLNYGAYAQTYFDYNTTNLANKDLDEVDKDVSSIDHDDVAGKAAIISGATEGIEAYGQSLKLKDEVSFKVYFRLTGGHTIDEYSFLDGSDILDPVLVSGNVYYVEINRTAAPDLDKNHTIVVKVNDGGNLSVTVSVLTYAEIVLRDTPTSQEEIDLANLVKALCLYNQKAKDLLGD